MNELVIQRHDFENAKKEIKVFRTNYNGIKPKWSITPRE